MLTVLTIAGLSIAFILFLNLLNAKDSAGTKSSKKKKTLPPRVDVKKFVNQPEEPGTLRPRICPLCGTLLSPDDYLVAALSEEIQGIKRQAHIYGCTYCYATDGVNLNSGAEAGAAKDRELTKMEP